MHIHRWSTIAKDIIAEYRKGAREKIYSKGNYERCEKCQVARFVPGSPYLYTVECEMILKKNKNLREHSRNRSDCDCPGVDL